MAHIEGHFESLAESNGDATKARHIATHEKGHGRVEDRYYTICPVPDSMAEEAKRWPGLKAIGMTTNVTGRDGEERIETRYYILSKYLSAKRFANAVRSHWSIENSCHWQLDVTFGENQCRVRKDHADANLSVVRRTALSLLKNEKMAKIGVKNKRLNAGWDEDYLAKVVFGT